MPIQGKPRTVGMSQATLNRLHLIGSLTAPPDRSQEAGLFANDMAAFPGVVDIGNENDQVS